MNHTVIIIPAFNEERSIRSVIFHIRQKALRTNVLVVDDASCDKTGQVAASAGAVVLRLQNNSGTGYATHRGLRKAARDKESLVVLMDADGQHDPAYIPRLLSEVHKGADYVIASRYIHEAPMTTSRLRAFGTKIISLWLWLWFGKRIYDPTSGYRAMSPKAHMFFSRHYPTFFSEPEAVICALEQGLVVKEIPSVMKPRLYGASSISPYKSVILMSHIFAFIPYRAVKRFFRTAWAFGR